MTRLNTTSVIALVTDDKSFWNWSNKELPAKPVSPVDSSLAEEVTIVIEVTSIPSLPIPTGSMNWMNRSRLVDSAPEPF
jgi:hypothetical protein